MAPAAYTLRKHSWYSFLLESESTPWPQCGRKDYVNEKFQCYHRESNPVCSAVPQPTAPARPPTRRSSSPSSRSSSSSSSNSVLVVGAVVVVAVVVIVIVVVVKNC
jgi:hypothetical protein